MAEPAAHLRDLVAATKPRRRATGDPSAPPWTRPNLAGRLVELSGKGASAALTFAVSLVLDAQRRGETAAWVTSRQSSFFPPDVAEHGVDLDALPVVRVPLPEHVARTAERLVRCGAFDLVVLDLGDRFDVPLPLLTRMLGLAERHEAAVLFLTEKGAAVPSCSSLVSLRAHAVRRRTKDGEFACELVASRDKRRPGGASPAGANPSHREEGSGGAVGEPRTDDDRAGGSASSRRGQSPAGTVPSRHGDCPAPRDRPRRDVDPAGLWIHRETFRGPDGVR